MKSSTMTRFSNGAAAIQVVMSMFLVSHIAFGQTSNQSKSYRQQFKASQHEGVIGVSSEVPLDNPSDNIFNISIPAKVAANDKIWLVYDLDGVQDHTAVSRSINEQLSVGGYLVKKRRGWETQRERLLASWLKRGDNVVKFTTPETANYIYKIRNVRIEIEPSGSNNVGVQMVFNKPSDTYYNNKAYIKGLISGTDGEKLTVNIEGKPARFYHGEFEGVVDFEKNQRPIAEVEVVYPNGSSTCENIAFNESRSEDYSFSMNKVTHQTEKFVNQKEIVALRIDGAELITTPNALKVASNLSITTLRDVDIPALDGGMVNVTRSHSGFRFLPHGTLFNTEVKVSLPVDFQKIPDGYTEKDIRTYYFDEQAHHWVSLSLDTVLLATGNIVSRTNHFTDMINAVLKVPESPEVNAYNSTSMKGIKAANPTAAVNLISPPQANNTGSANIGYPINLPAGRNGMQPQIDINYNSDGGNSWLGLGWNLNVPAISIDTRWGVPRYDATNETETYSMSGEQLTPVAHRGALVSRSNEKQFYPRVEGSFNKIIRHGSTPANYWWEVIDKTGTRYFYGGDPISGVDKTTVLRTDEVNDKGNIAYWALSEVRDLNNNFVKYHYAKISDTGLTNGTVKGYQLYIDKITYTGYSGIEGKYSVLFTRDRELNEARRVDVTISANLGFKEVTADLLRKIEVQFDGKNIRSYELKYVPGALFKTLLGSVSEYDAAGKIFNTHTFDYYNELGKGNAFIPLAKPENWTPQNDNVKGSLVITKDEYTDKVSALGGTKSVDKGAGMTVTVGLATSSFISKILSVGGSVGYSESKSDGLLSMIDINGDGLPDKVFMKGNTMHYRPNQSGTTGNTTFGADRQVSLVGANGFYKEKSTTLNYGFEANAIAFVGLGGSKTTSVTSVYFTEVNGDQLPDLMVNGNVYFNHIDPTTGDPIFTASSSDTPSPIFGVGSVDGNIIEPDPQEMEKAIDESPLHDVVRMWRAPYSGQVKITAPVRLLESHDSERAAAPADGVNVKIQHKNSELWKARIGATDYSEHVPSGVNNISVNKGDQIYFRVQSVYNGSYDSVHWVPNIQYVNKDNLLADANAKQLYSFSADKDYVLTTKQVIGVPFNGSVVVEGDFVKPVTSDNLRAEILQISNNQKDTAIVWSADYNWSKAIQVQIKKQISIDSTQLLVFRVSASTNVDWSSIQWHPHVYYVSSNDSRYVIDNSSGTPSPLIDFYPIPEFTMFADVRKISTPFTLTDSAFTVTPHLEFANPFARGRVVFSVKKLNKLIYKDTLSITNGVVSNSPGDTTLKAKKGDQIFIEYYIADGEHLASVVTKSTATIKVKGQETDFEAGLSTTYYLEKDAIYGPLYRNWGQFAYNGNREKADAIINESLLKLSDQLKNSPSSDAIKKPDDLTSQGAYNPSTEQFIPFGPMGKQKFWQGYDAQTFVNASVISSSRLGNDDLTIASVVPGGGARGINKISKTKGSSFSAGVGYSGVSAGYNNSDGTTDLLADFIDMNGDRYPDIVTDNRIQYSTANGGLENTYVSHAFGPVHETKTSSEGLSAGAFVSSTVKGGRNAKTSVGNAKVSGGINGSYGKGTNDASFSWMDINGDGLPDKVYAGGNVALNLGYSFAPLEPWGYTDISKGNSTSKSAGLSLSYGNGSQSASYSAGIGLALSENFMTGLMEDVNGDGLVDEVKSSDGAVQVKLNTGNGFSSTALDWTGASQLNRNSTSSQSANVSFTGCFAVWLIKICLNPNVNIGNGVSRDLKKLTDMDGDGFPDYVMSDADDNLKVSRSAIGRTNLLKGVTRPMGSTFAISYKRIGNTYEMPQNKWALDSVKVFDGFKGDGVDNTLTTYNYEGGLYNRNEREFFGFSKVISNTHDTEKSTKPVYSAIAQIFNNSNYYEKGLILSEIMTDGDGNKFVEKMNTYELKDIASGASLPESVKNSTTPGNAFPALVKTEQRFYEGQSQMGKSTSTTYGYDQLGNVTTYSDYGDEGPEDDISSLITYYALTDKYIMNSPQQIIVKGSGITYRKRESVIDPVTGDIKQIKQYLSDKEVAIYSMEYNQYGNLTKIIRPKNTKDQQLSFNYEYDNSVSTYMTKVSSSYGYNSEATYDFRFGELLTSKDLNGNVVTYTLDDLGRITTIVGPYEKSNGNGYTIKFDYHPNDAIPWALTSHYDPSDPKNDLQTSIFVDGLGRVLQTKKDVSVYAGDGKTDVEMMAISGRVRFDALGRTVRALYPITEMKGSPGSFNANEDVIKPTLSTYDVMNRLLTLTLPDGSITKTGYGFENDRSGKKQFSVKTTDANGKQTEQFTDVRGRVTSIKNYTSDKPVWTSFNYNAINEQIASIDDMGSTTISTYDNLGRRVSRTHPDAGTTTYSYDLAGNLKSLVTANLQKIGQTISYTYDYERLIGINYPENPENNVKYTYGLAGASDNRVGRIVLQEDATGAQEFFYGPLGEVVKNIRTIVLPKFTEQTYTTEWQYDTWNRLTSMVYADGEIINYTYNSGGLLKSMAGKKKNTTFDYVNQIGYDKFEQRVFLAYGNGAKTSYSYESDRRRLKSMTAQTTAKRLFMDNTYSYDKMNNILELKNNAPIPSANLMGGSSDYTFDYDDLYRLTKAQGAFKGPNSTESYSLDMNYNSVGGIVNKVQNHLSKGKIQKKTSYNFRYTYSSEQPHAPVHIGEQTYTYDANGNQTGWTDDKTGQNRRIMWDEENRIRSIYDNGAQHHYIYDATGERVIKGKSTGERIFVNGEWKAGSGGMGNYTVYVNPYIVLKSGSYTKHYYIEGQRIVSKIGGGWDSSGKGTLNAGGNKVNYSTKSQELINSIVKNLKFLGSDGQLLTAGNSGKIPPGQIKGGSGAGNSTEKFQYFYHPDHLGSTSYITDASGEVYQHLEYFAFGETFVEEHNNTDRTPYLYSGKELDEETDLYYYGARYYDPRTSVWESVDPMAEKYPSSSGYVYCSNNPIIFVDPNGKYYVGKDGNPVSVTIKDGKLVLGKNASADLKRMAELTNNSGSATAISQFEKVGNNKTKVNFKFSKEVLYNKDGKLIYGHHQPHDSDGKPVEFDSNEGTVKGKADFITDSDGNVAYKEVTITIFEDAVEIGERDKDSGLVVVKAHEDQHDLDTKNIQARKDRQEGKSNNRDLEMTPNVITNIVTDEIKENKKED